MPGLYQSQNGRNGEMECINLSERFGDRYKIGFDPAYSPFNVPREKRDPWYMLLTFRGGDIHPQGADMLVVEVDGRHYIKARLDRLDCTTLNNDGDHFGSFMFHVDDFDEIAAIVRPHRRPQISDERRRELSKRMTEMFHQSPETSQRRSQESLSTPEHVV